MGGRRAAHRAAVLVSLVQTWKHVGVDPFVYLRDVIDRVSTHPMSRIGELTPRQWQQRRQARSPNRPPPERQPGGRDTGARAPGVKLGVPMPLRRGVGFATAYALAAWLIPAALRSENGGATDCHTGPGRRAHPRRTNVGLFCKFCVAAPLLSGADRRFSAGQATSVARRRTTCSKTGGWARETPSRTGRQLDPILVVDDDLICCRMKASALEQEGYSVEVTADPTEALELLHARPHALVVSDVSMPGMSGTTLAAEAARLQPGLQTLLVSALSDRQLRADAEALGSLLLTKPVRLEVLSAAVRTLLDGGGATRGTP